MISNTNKNYIKLTEDLIRFPSVSDNLKSKKEVIAFAKKYFHKDRFRIKEYTSRGLPSLVVTFKEQSDNPDLLLCGHLDVVPDSPAGFCPKTTKKRIYGRGSGDMKAACAVMMEIMSSFGEQKKPPSLGLMLTSDEEVGGFNGVGYLLNKKNYKPKLAIIPDGGTDLNTLVLNEKGVLHLKVKAFGRSAHGSRPFLGHNAVEKLIEIYKSLRVIIPELKPDEWANSLNLGRLQGGEATNQVPDYGEMYLDIRFINNQEKLSILERIKQITTDFEIISEAPPFVQDDKDEYVKRYKKEVEGVLGQEVKFHRSEGASDARFFSEIRVPVVSTKINCDNIHSRGEWVDIGSMNNFFEILSLFIKNNFQ